MLLRASRVSGFFTKEALLAKAIGSVAGTAAKAAVNHPKLVGGTALTGAIAGPEISKGISEAQRGLKRDALVASRERNWQHRPQVRLWNPR